MLQHLLEIAFVQRDTALARRVWPAVDRIVVGAWDWGMAVAALVDDAPMYAAQQRRAGPIVLRPTASTAVVESAIPAARSDEILSLLARFTGEPGERTFYSSASAFEAAIVQGRPSVARGIMQAETRADVKRRLDLLAVFAALYADGPREAGAEAALRLGRITNDDRPGALARCAAALWDLETRGVAHQDEPVLRRWHPACAAIIDAGRAMREQRPNTRDLLVAADSLLRARINLGDPWQDASAFLARAFEASGDLARARGLWRLRQMGFAGALTLATRTREEGRLAAVMGDTAGAVRAYRRYLLHRQDAEPALVPQRDSVRAALALLEPPR